MDRPTRDHDEENFPTASLLLDRAVRARVLAFYRFVRAADDVADHPRLGTAQKLAELDRLEAALDDPATARPEARRLHALGVGTAEARRMLAAFRQDVGKRRYADWAELEAYCTRSADPVGRLLLRLHDEDTAAAGPAADALCTALQLLNHLQDLLADRNALNRIYLPLGWMARAGGEAEFFLPARAAERRLVLDAALDRVAAKLDAAAALPRLLRSRRLALQASMTMALARRLLARLRAADPVPRRVALSRLDFARAFATAARPLTDAAIVRAAVARSGSSFARGMASLRGEKRRALWAVYAFCRAVDDIADSAMPEAEKRRFLAEWRGRLGAPDCALSRELAWARGRFGLPVQECQAMIAGMETDAADRLRLADAAALEAYCRHVAGSAGAMAVRIFGAPEAEGFGLALGRTFQLVNILRDLDEDAARERVYLPLDLLAAHGIADAPAARIMRHPRLGEACRPLAEQARAGFARAEAELAGLDARALLPARVMMWGYRRLLERLLARGFDGTRQPRPRLGAAEQLRMAAMALGLARRPRAA